MKYRPPKITSAVTELVCSDGCNPDPMPISEFYQRGTSVDGFPLYGRRCRKCHAARMKALYDAKPKTKRGRRGGFNPPMKALPIKDIFPCVACGLRGHAAGDQDEAGDPRCPQARRFAETGLGARGEDWAL